MGDKKEAALEIAVLEQRIKKYISRLTKMKYSQEKLAKQYNNLINNDFADNSIVIKMKYLH